MRTVVILLRHEDGRQMEARLIIPIGKRIDGVWLGIALDCLGIDNPEPWTIIDWGVQS